MQCLYARFTENENNLRNVSMNLVSNGTEITPLGAQPEVRRGPISLELVMGAAERQLQTETAL